VKRKNLCYLALCEPPSAKQRLKATLAMLPQVYRVTDHGGHIKINATRPLPAIKGLHAIKVKDQTTHFDAVYWDFAMAAFKHATTKKHGAQALGVMAHYLINLFGVPEAEWHEYAAASRRYLNAAVSDEEAHGWEFPHIERLRKQMRGGR
jgi:hypothetical protein